MRRTGMVLVALLLVGCSSPAPPPPEPVKVPSVSAPAATPGPTPGPAPGQAEPPRNALLDAKPIRAAVTAAIEGRYGPDQLKLTEKANLSLDTATSAHPDWAEAWDERARWELALQADRRGGYSSREAVEKALALAPDLLSARYHRALVSLFDRQYAEALARLDAVAQKAPNDAGVQVGRGLALLGLGRKAEGAQACGRGAELDPKGQGAQDCVNALGVGFPVLPEAEFTLGFYQWTANGYLYRGKTPQGDAETNRISPPDYCRYTYHDGFSTTTVCQGDGLAYDWTFWLPFTGQSQKGIGIGSPREAVVAAWGAGKVVGYDSCYAGESATLCLHFGGATVDKIIVKPVNLKTMVRLLALDGY